MAHFTVTSDDIQQIKGDEFIKLIVPMPLGDTGYVLRPLADGRFLIGGNWNGRSNRWEKMHGKTHVTWGHTLDALAAEWPEETFSTVDAAKAFLANRARKAANTVF